MYYIHRSRGTAKSLIRYINFPDTIRSVYFCAVPLDPRMRYFCFFVIYTVYIHYTLYIILIKKGFVLFERENENRKIILDPIYTKLYNMRESRSIDLI